MNMWTELQAAALDNLGIPRYKLNQAVTPADVEVTEAEAKPSTKASLADTPVPPQMEVEQTPDAPPSVAPVAAEAPQPVLYQLGPWVLQFPQALPVNSYPWLKDLSQFIDSRPTQVSAAGHKAIIDCTFVAKEQLNQDEKRALWQQLKPYLTQ